MNRALVSTFLLLGFALTDGAAQSATNLEPPQNYIFFNRDRHRVSERSFLETKSIAGAQLKYTWRELEPERDRYELGALLEDLAYLGRHGKKLWIQLQEVSFDERLNIPDYLVDDPAFGGGAERKYETTEEAGEVFDGWVARRWDPAVRERFAKLLTVLGAELDGKIEGLNLPETAIDFGENGDLHPDGFTYESYVEGVTAIMTAAQEAFSQSHVMIYANFMPGEWLPWEDRGYLRSVYRHAERTGVGVGGPDLRPHRRGHQNHSYPLIAARGPDIVGGLAVQWGNLEDNSPDTGERVTADELYRFARDQLRLDYIFWGTQEPYYTEQILTHLRDLDRREAR